MKRKLSREPGNSRLVRVLTPKVLGAFLSLLSLTGSPKTAALRLGLNRKNLYLRREQDPEFKERWDQAIKDSQDALEDEAYRRAVIGITEPVFQGGVLVGHVQKYSDGLLTFLLKAHNPAKFSEKLQVSGPNGGPIQHQMDLSKLNESELATLEQLLTKTAADAAASEGGKG